MDTGILVLLGIEEADNEDDVSWLSRKIAGLRIFNDPEGKMNNSLRDSGGKIMVISQFTLHASVRKGTRPSFMRAAHPDRAIPLYQAFVEQIGKDGGCEIITGEFGAHMAVELVNDGPVTITIDTKNKE
jgi:D-tyrosyl-tRNA(Tyr) deacylase